MSLKQYLAQKGFKLVSEEENEKVVMDDYEFYIHGSEVVLPIPLPKGNESLDDLVSMGIKYARACRLSQGLGGPLEYKLVDNSVLVVKKFNDRKELEEKLIKALEGIESLRYFL